VPVVDASLVDLTVRLSEPATVCQVNAAFATAGDGPPKGMLRCATEPIVSHDVIGEEASCLFDAGLTRCVDSTAKVFGWYDNEWGTRSAPYTWSTWWPARCPVGEPASAIRSRPTVGSMKTGRTALRTWAV
jgi:hypothetical protein